MRKNQKKTSKDEQDERLAPSMEMDALDREATADEVEEGDSTSVTKVYIDRLPE